MVGSDAERTGRGVVVPPRFYVEINWRAGRGSGGGSCAWTRSVLVLLVHKQELSSVLLIGWKWTKWTKTTGSTTEKETRVWSSVTYR